MVSPAGESLQHTSKARGIATKLSERGRTTVFPFRTESVAQDCPPSKRFLLHFAHPVCKLIRFTIVASFVAKQHFALLRQFRRESPIPGCTVSRHMAVDEPHPLENTVDK
jgi:hypothetical protein